MFLILPCQCRIIDMHSCVFISLRTESTPEWQDKNFQTRSLHFWHGTTKVRIEHSTSLLPHPIDLLCQQNHLLWTMKFLLFHQLLLFCKQYPSLSPFLSLGIWCSHFRPSLLSGNGTNEAPYLGGRLPYPFVVLTDKISSPQMAPRNSILSLTFGFLVYFCFPSCSGPQKNANIVNPLLATPSPSLCFMLKSHKFCSERVKTRG